MAFSNVTLRHLTTCWKEKRSRLRTPDRGRQQRSEVNAIFQRCPSPSCNETPESHSVGLVIIPDNI